MTMCGPTSDHDEIRSWAGRHNAQPAQKKPIVFDSEPAMLHFVFGKDMETEEIRSITWDSFFAQFDLMGLSFVFDESPWFELLQQEPVSLYPNAARSS